MIWSWFSFLVGAIVGLILYGFGLAYWMSGVNACLQMVLDEMRDTR